MKKNCWKYFSNPQMKYPLFCNIIAKEDLPNLLSLLPLVVFLLQILPPIQWMMTGANAMWFFCRNFNYLTQIKLFTAYLADWLQDCIMSISVKMEEPNQSLAQSLKLMAFISITRIVA